MTIHQFCHEARRRVVSGMLSGLLTLAALLPGIITPAEAAYRPETKVVLKGKAKTMLREALAAFNALPDIGRQAIIANRLELYFSEEGDSRYNSWDHCPNSGAKFVCADGSLRDWRQVKDSIPPVQWNDADRKVYDLGANAVFPSVSREVTPLIYETAKFIVRSMPHELRDSWLAEEAGLLYTASGAKAYAKGTTSTTTDSGKEVKSRKLASLYDLRFIDAEGQEQQYAKVLADHSQQYERRRKVLYLCIQYTSRKEILDLFSDELSTLRKNAKGAQENDDADDDAPKSSATANKLKEALANLPKESQEAFLSEQLGMCFMADGSNALSSKRAKSGAIYIGSDGEEHNVSSDLSKASSSDLSKARDTFRSANKSQIISAFRPELIAMAHETAPVLLRAMPDMMRDAWLSETAELCYASGDNKPYTGKIGAVRTETGVEVRFKSLNLKYARFVDAKGVEHKPSERDAQWAKWGKRWTILHFCAQVGGNEDIFKAMPLELDALRRAHSKATGTPYTPPADLNRTAMGDTTSPSAQSTTAMGDTQAPPQKVDTPTASAPVKLLPRTTIPTTPPALAPTSDADSPVVATFKQVPQSAREAKLAAMLGICYMEDGSKATQSQNNYVRTGAKFIGSDGKVYDFKEEQAKVYQHWSALSAADADEAEKMAVYQAMPEVITQLLLQNAAHHLKAMPELVRDAWICELYGLYFIEGGTQSAYTGGSDSSPMANGFRLPYKDIRGNSLFRDTKGVTHPWRDRQAYWNTWMWRWNICQFCAAMLGIDKVLSACVPDEANTLRKLAPEATQFPFEPLKPLLDSDNEAVTYLRELPANRRYAWLSELMGLCFMKDGSSSVDEKNWIKRGALYIDPTGKEHDFWTDLNGPIWNKVNAMLPHGKHVILNKMPEEAEALALANIKYHLLNMPPLMRDAWLCIFGNLCFMDGSDADPYEKEPGEFRTDKGNTFKIKRIRGDASFVDTKGEKHGMSDRRPFWKECAKTWNISVVSLKYCKISKVLEAFGAEVATLRKNYETATGKKAPGAESAPAAEESSGSRKTGMGTQWL